MRLGIDSTSVFNNMANLGTRIGQLRHLTDWRSFICVGIASSLFTVYNHYKIWIC